MDTPKPAPSIVTRLSLWLCLVATVFILVLLAFEYKEARAYILKATQLEARSVVTDVDLQVEELLSNAEHSVEALAALLPYQVHSSQALKQSLESYLQSNKRLYGAAIAFNPEHPQVDYEFAPYMHRDTVHSGLASKSSKPHGELKTAGLSYKNLAAPNYSYRQQRWYSEVVKSKKSRWSEPYFDEGGGNILMATYSVPVFVPVNGESQLLAVVTSDIALSNLQEIISQIKLGESGYGMLFSVDGLIISHPKQSHVMKAFDYGLDVERRDSWLQVQQQIFEGERGILQAPCLHQQRSCFVAGKALSTNAWPMVVVYPEDELFAPLKAYLLRIVFVALVALLALIGIVWMLISSLTRPLAQLAEHTRHIGEGNFDSDIDVAASSREVIQLNEAVNSMQRRLVTYLQDLESQTAARSQLEAELGAARDIQMALLAGSEGRASLASSAFALWAELTPASKVGGDLYYWLERDGRLLAAVGDVSGKGMPAALFMAKTLSLLSAFGHQYEQLDELLETLNKELSQDNPECMFVTLSLLELDLQSGALSVVSAGHQEPILLADDCLPLELDGGPAMGLYEGAKYPLNKFDLKPGSQLILYSDGLDEAFDTQKRCFGLAAMLDVLAQVQGASVAGLGAALLEKIAQHSQGALQNDDRTLLVIEWKPQVFFVSKPLLSPGFSLLEVDPEHYSLTTLLAQVDHYLQELTVDLEVGFRLKLIVEELFLNVRNYAKSPIDLLLAYHDNEFLLECRDSGPEFNPLQYQRAEAAEGEVLIGGLGIELIKESADTLNYCRQQNKNIISLSLLANVNRAN
ncbi:SpoIIE family protein phosphatase [Agaribacterium sp. ZY112]|uniref:SpoIIE family protein phosphatase n=1 Tax=Agaribacterium sp. ZY112 TaxID=3233574 RepID=UPI0035257769